MNPRRTQLPLTAVAALLALYPAAGWGLTENYVPGPGDYIFYTFALCGILFSAIIVMAYREYKWLGYTGLSALMVLNAATMDGTFVYLVDGGEFTLWVVPFLVFSATAVYGYALAALRLEDPHPLTRYRRPLWRLAAITAIFPLTSVLWLKRIPLDLMWIPVQFLFFGMVLAHILPPQTWQTGSRRQRLFTRAFPVVVGGFTVSAYLAHYLFLDLDQLQQNVLHRIVLLLFTGFALTVVIWQAFSSARAREEAERETLDARRKEAEMKLALSESEQQYERAREAAARNQSQLASVSHDLKQPIAALRATLERLEDAGSDNTAEKLGRAVEYIDSLAGSYVSDSEDAHGRHMPDNGEPLPQGQEWVRASVYSQTLSQMFGEDAERRGVDLRIRDSETAVRSDPLVTMRILSNLVANALEHADPRTVLAGFRRRGERLLFQVYDNGRGMSDSNLARYLEQGEKSEASSGSGLGLAIVQALCEQQGCNFTIRSEPGHGTCASVVLGEIGR